MEAAPRLVAYIDELIRLFNQRSMDLPDGLFTRHTQLLLNDVPFEEMLLGSQNGPASPSDPLVLMIARGAAGYRFAAKAVQHAVPDATLERGEISASHESGRVTLRTSCWLSGHYRGTGQPANDMVHVALALAANGSIEKAMATLDETAVGRLREARSRP